jgi:hypothetical protein
MIVLVDFQHRQVTIPNKHRYRRGDTVWVSVINYNPYLYQAAVNGTDTATETPTAGALFSSFLNPTNLSTIVAGLAPGAGAATLSLGNISTELNAKVNDARYGIIMATSSQPVRDFMAADSARKVKPPPPGKHPKLTPEERLEILAESADEIYQDYLQKVKQDQKNIDTLNNNLQEQLYVLSGKTDFLYDTVPENGYFNSKVLMDTLKATYGRLKRQVDVELNKLNEEQFQLNVEIAPLKVLYSGKNDTVNKNEVRVRDSLLNNFYVQGIKVLTKLDSTVSMSEVLRRKNAIMQINPLRTTYTSLPLYFLNGPKDITVSITPWSDSSRLPSYNTTIELPLLHYFILGVSAGFYTSWLGDQNYAADSTTSITTDTVTSYRLIKDGTSHAEVGAVAHVYAAGRIASELYLGGSFGAGVSFAANPKPRLFLGGTLIYGDYNRLVLTVGLATGYTQRMSSAFSLDKPYGSPPTSVTSNVMKVSPFISLTYSFLNN